MVCADIHPRCPMLSCHSTSMVNQFSYIPMPTIFRSSMHKTNPRGVGNVNTVPFRKGRKGHKLVPISEQIERPIANKAVEFPRLQQMRQIFRCAPFILRNLRAPVFRILALEIVNDLHGFSFRNKKAPRHHSGGRCCFSCVRIISLGTQAQKRPSSGSWQSSQTYMRPPLRVNRCFAWL